jgi:hypothetical protein
LSLRLQQRQFIHAAAVGDREGAILLVGKGGSGKSTTSLACLDWGMEYLGDDYCVLSNDSGLRVHSLYASAKLCEAAWNQFPSLHSLRRESGAEKDALYLNEKLLSQMPLERAVKAIFIPQIQDRAETQLQPASFAAALKAIAPTTLFQLAGTDHITFHTLAHWLKPLPCYFLQLGQDMKKVPKVIGDFLRRTK